MKHVILTFVMALLSAGAAHAADAPASIVVIVNPTSGVEKLTRDEVIDIFLGRYR